MHHKSIILGSLKQSFVQIRKKKSLFAFMLLLQIAFFSAFFFVGMEYLPRALEKAQAISDYMSMQDFDELSMASGIMEGKIIFGDDPLSVSRNFEEMMKNFKLYLAYTFALMIFSASVLWAFANKVIYNYSFVNLAKNFFRNLAVLSFCLGTIFYFFYSMLDVTLADAAESGAGLLASHIPFFVFSVIIAHFMFVSLSLLHGTGLKNIIQKALFIGIKKAYYILAAYFINIMLFAVSAALVYLFVEKHFSLLMLSVMLMVFSFVFGRMFVVNVVEQLEGYRKI